jgi:hypothetical protein
MDIYNIKYQKNIFSFHSQPIQEYHTILQTT